MGSSHAGGSSGNLGTLFHQLGLIVHKLASRTEDKGRTHDQGQHSKDD